MFCQWSQIKVFPAVTRENPSRQLQSGGLCPSTGHTHEGQAFLKSLTERRPLALQMGFVLTTV